METKPSLPKLTVLAVLLVRSVAALWLRVAVQARLEAAAVGTRVLVLSTGGSTLLSYFTHRLRLKCMLLTS